MVVPYPGILRKRGLVFQAHELRVGVPLEPAEAAGLVLWSVIDTVNQDIRGK